MLPFAKEFYKQVEFIQQFTREVVKQKKEVFLRQKHDLENNPEALVYSGEIFFVLD